MSLFKNVQWKDLGLSYEEAVHGMQSAVLVEIVRSADMSAGWQERMWSDDPTRNTAAAGPKHLRVGINSAMVEHSALAWLLINKGVITEEEYLEALRLAMNNELHTFQEKFGVSFG